MSNAPVLKDSSGRVISGHPSWNRDDGGNNGGGGGELEARVAQLETHVQYIRRDIDSLKDDVREFRGEAKGEFSGIRSDMRVDFRLVFGSLIVVALGLAGMMAKGFGWL
ncbi:hypothetical protein [Pseudomonas sp. GL-R-26]|uniref:hypothetical protein n=1 Tax=Pseudomonas sp. GL-R-26 TaxID=2832392 RepID=UPI001CC09B4F|nr:hypothetical protein [Pseudomonas sp. GL-R-26]